MGDASGVRALEFTFWFPTDSGPYAALQSQDPAVPANVDERDWRNGKVADPAPVKLTGEGDLEANLFTISEINWDAIHTILMNGDAPAAVVSRGRARSRARRV